MQKEIHSHSVNFEFKSSSKSAVDPEVLLLTPTFKMYANTYVNNI